MEISWKWLNLCLGLLFFQFCNGFPINLEDSVADQHTQLLTGLVAVLLTVCSVVLLAGCLCCQRRNGFKEFRDSPVVASAASNLDHGHVNPIANGEFTIFTPLSSSPYNNNVFLANERIITRTAEDFVYEDFDVSSWFNESEKDFPRIKLKYIKELGKGWFGKVVEGAAKEVPPNEEAWTPVVVRILEASASRKERVLFLNDAAIYRCGVHANILSLIGRCLDTVPLLLLQEYCPQGDLKNYLRSKKENVEQLLSTDYPLLWCCQLTSALKHLHNNGVTHPDLATRNCQLTSDLTLKVGDYGLSENKYPGDYYQGSPRVPVRWCSPESLTCTLTTIQPKKTTTESNIWSLGVTMWEICECGEQPYSALSDDEVVSQVFGVPNIRLSRPSFPILYTDYLYRLMQLCWTNAESRPTVSQIDLMLSDLWQVYKNTKSSTLSADDFDKRWESFKPNLMVNNDIVDNEDTETHITKPLSPSLNNLHGSLDNLLDSGEQMELWLENVTKSDLSLAKSTSNAVLSLDDPLVSEISSSESSDRVSPKQKKSKLKSKIDFDLNTKFRDSSIKHPYNFSDSALFSQRTSSESETEDENWRKKVERGAYTEKVRLKSRSVADLMILTHVDYSESESETPLPSLDYRVNYKNVRYAPKNNLENVSLTYGSEGNLLSVHNTFQEELKKLKEERRDSLLFVPDNHSQTSFNKLDNNNPNFPLEELTLSDSNLNNMSMIDSTSKRLMHELNRVAEIQPANQVFNVFSVTIDKFKPIHVNSCKLNDIINFSDIEPSVMSEQNNKTETIYQEHKRVKREAVVESPLLAKESLIDRQRNEFCDTKEKHISNFVTGTYPPALDDDNLQSQSKEADLYQLSSDIISNRDEVNQTDIQRNNVSHDIKPFIHNIEVETNSSDDTNAVDTINPIFFNDALISDFEAEFSTSNTESNTEASTPRTVVPCKSLTDDLKPMDWNIIDFHNLNEKLNGDQQSQLNVEINSDHEKENYRISESKLTEISRYEIPDVVSSINKKSVHATDKFAVPKLSEIIENKRNICKNPNGSNEPHVNSIDDSSKSETCRSQELSEVSDVSDNSVTELIKEFQEPNIPCGNHTDDTSATLKIIENLVHTEDINIQEPELCGNKTTEETNEISVSETNDFTSETEKITDPPKLLDNQKITDDTSSISDVVVAEEDEKLLQAQLSKLSDIFENQIFIDNEILVDLNSKPRLNTDMQIPPETNTIETQSFNEDFKEANAVQSPENLNSDQQNQNKHVIDLKTLPINIIEAPTVSNDFEMSSGNDESLCEARNVVLIPKLSEMIENRGLIYNINLFPEKDKPEPKLEMDQDEVPKGMETESVKEDNHLDKINIKTPGDSNCELQEKLQSKDIVDLDNIIIIETNRAPGTEKIVQNEGEDLFFEEKSNTQVPKLSDIVKNSICYDEDSANRCRTYQVDSQDMLLAERNNYLPELKIAEDTELEASEMSISENFDDQTEVNKGNIVNSNENLYCDTFQNNDIIHVDDIVISDVVEGSNSQESIRPESNDNLTYPVNLIENSSDEFNTHKDIVEPNKIVDENEAPEVKDPQFPKPTEASHSDPKAPENLNCNSQEKHQNKDDVSDVKDVIFTNIDKASKYVCNIQESTINELNGSLINTDNSTENSNCEINKYKDTVEVNDIVLVDVNEVPQEMPKEDKSNHIKKKVAESIENLNHEPQQELKNNSINFTGIVPVDECEIPEENNLHVRKENEANVSELNVANSTKNSNCEQQEKDIVNLNDIILVDVNEIPETLSNFQVPKLSQIILSKQDQLEVKGDEILKPNSTVVVTELSEELQNKSIVPQCSTNGHSNKSEQDIDIKDKITEEDESQACDKEDVLESKNIIERKDKECIEDTHLEHNKITSVILDLSGGQEEVLPNVSTNLSVFTSTPASRSIRNYVRPKDTYSHLNLFDVATEKEEKNLDFFSDLVPLDTSKELNYSLETWDNFLGRTLDAQQDIQNENLFDSFSSEPHSLLFVESGNDLVQPHECTETKHMDEKDVMVSNENNPNISNVNNGTFVVETKNDNTFVKGDSEMNNGTFTLNKTESVESETEDVGDNSAWANGGGWFLHPQTQNKEPSGTIEVRENTGSYVGFGIDDEIMAAIRNELLNKLPHAQVAPSEKVTEVEEWDSGEKNEVFLKYNIYNPPLSPIMEESYIEESDILSPRQDSDNEESEWSEPDMPETLPPEAESQSAHTYDSQLKGPHHRHTPSQDSCCSNDTLFNLEELTCVGGDVEKENDLTKNAVSEPEIVNECELENNESNEVTLEEICIEEDKKVQNTTPDDVNGSSEKSEEDNNINCRSLNNIIVPEKVNINLEEIEDTKQEIDEVNSNCSNDDDRKTNVSEIKPSEDSDYIIEFISQEIEHSSKQFYKLSDGSSSEPNSSLEESPVAFKKVQIAPLPSPEDNPWKQLPASLLSYDKVISQNNTLLLPATVSNDVVPELNDLPKDNDIVESQCKDVDEECATLSKDSHDPSENCDRKDTQHLYENIKDEQPNYENIKEKEPFYENLKDAQPVYENVKDTQPLYQNFNVPSDIYNEVDYVNIVNLENSKNNTEYVNDKKDSDQDENKIINESNRDEDIYGMLTDIKFNGPSENQLISTSFSESNDINDEQDWDSGSDTRSSSSGEFIWKEGEHEESLKALRAAPQDVLEDIKPMEGIAEESTDESDVSSSTSDEEGEAPEFVPSAWDKFATPTKSALRSPEKTLEKSEKNKSKGVWFKKQKYHCVYEYPREPESPVLQSQDLWKPQLDYSSFTDWEFDADTYFPSTVDDNDIFPSAYNYQPKSISSRNLYQLTSISDFVPSNTGLEDEFFVSSGARPFDVAGSLSSQFFPGSTTWNGESATPDSGVEDSTPGSSTEMEECSSNIKMTNSSSCQSLKKLASEAVKRSKQMSIKSNDALGGLRHTRNKLKLDLPPSPSAFTSTKMFTVEPTLEPVIREKPTFTTFGKSRFSVQHVDTPPDESKNKNVSFEALPYKPLKEESVQIDVEESCPDINEEIKLEEKHILRDKFDCGKSHEYIRGEASLLDSADEDSGIESSTLERKMSNDGLLH